MIRQSQWFVKWVLPASLSALVGGMLFATLYWAASETNDVAAERQKDLVTLIVSKIQTSVAHDQESATVWDDAVIKTKDRDLDWIDVNLGQWMNTYFSHDAAVVLSADGQPIFRFVAKSAAMPSSGDLRQAYAPLVTRLQERLLVGDQQGVTDKTLSIGESDLAYVGSRPAVVSVKPIISDTGEIGERAGEENLHVAVRFLDDALPKEIGSEYRFAEMQFTTTAPDDKRHSQIALTSRSGQVIGYFNWHPFEPGTNVLRATLPVLGLAVFGVFVAASLAGHAIWRRSVKLHSNRRELQHLALHDTLTGLANRAHFKRELALRVQQTQPDETCSVLFIDLDRFKAVNDTYGHPTGDRLISLVAKRMSEILPGALIGRIGGDEFTVFLQRIQAAEVAVIADRIVACLREPFDIDGVHVSIGASVGAAIGPGASADAAELTRQADIALYHAKAAGRNTYALFGEHMDDLLRSRRKLEQDLREALETGTQIEVVYQPVYLADSSGPCSVEALARWKHPELGSIAPDVFIPLAEEIGVVHTIGALVLDDACSLIASLPETRIAVNASAVELGSPGYSLRVLSALAKWGIEPARLEIEITESLVISREGETDQNIMMLRAAGVKFAIDDFGTGYSSFSRVQNVTVDRIKIDKSFIGAIGEGKNTAIVEAIINMARAQGLQTTAEGVETDQQREVLKSLGCNNIQGFLMSRPIARGEIIALLGPREARIVRV
ncbi:putative bifunctional diguanylate cyclase/phosphodiesterase [Rhizobium sp. Root482]|uniref:putative bifunctional diguanylate cyclase/phosphodiesterase n=1 Tax=Rhizobium sp. Root482 TaxID=1736543 RepID=UPI0006F7A20A|nr:EAL domain-containing protein [Rhizobium sp. Root482]KQY21543.1 diguanylate cyclase [Rhizobium sp. Root482]